MLKRANTIRGYRLTAPDGEIGAVNDFFFDQEDWTIRYVMVKAEEWLPDRRVLIAPAEFDAPDWSRKVLPISLTKEKIKNSPKIPLDLPISRAHEIALADYYAWQPYWITPVKEAKQSERAIPPESCPRTDSRLDYDSDIRLHGLQEIKGYRVCSVDGRVGYVEDLGVETADCQIRYLIVDGWDLYPGRHFVVPTSYADSLDWMNIEIRISLSRKEIQTAPELNPDVPFNPKCETEFDAFYKQLAASSSRECRASMR